jgi:bifunctional UDP-N-acetylglucosamine pyrophosphorylase/glucosamine-1-phosphate N-acetyltransferase
MIHYVVDAALEAGADDVVVVVGTARELVRRTSPRPSATACGSRCRPSSAARGTPWSARCPRSRDDADELLSSAATRRCSTPPSWRASSRPRATPRRASSRCSPCEVERSHRLRPHPPRRGGASSAIREHKDCSAEERLPSARSTRRLRRARAFLRERGPAASRRTTRRASSTSPTSSRRRAATAGGVPRARRGRRCPSRASTIARSSPSRRGGALRAHRRRHRRARRHRAHERAHRRGRHRRARRHDRARRRAARRDADRRGAVIDVGSRAHGRGGRGRRGVKPYTVATRSTVGVRAQIGPFSHLRPRARSRRTRTSATSSRPRRPRSARARRPTTSRTSATATSARARTSARAPSSATTTASRSTRPRSARAPSSADSTRSSWPRARHRRGRLRGDRHDGDD